MKTKRTPGPIHSGPADHVVGEAAARAPGIGVGTGTDTTPSSDWLEEAIEAAPPEPGVPVSTRAPGDKRRGQAIESKRGQR